MHAELVPAQLHVGHCTATWNPAAARTTGCRRGSFHAARHGRNANAWCSWSCKTTWEPACSWQVGCSQPASSGRTCSSCPWPCGGWGRKPFCLDKRISCSDPSILSTLTYLLALSSISLTNVHYFPSAFPPQRGFISPLDSFHTPPTHTINTPRSPRMIDHSIQRGNQALHGGVAAANRIDQGPQPGRSGWRPRWSSTTGPGGRSLSGVISPAGAGRHRRVEQAVDPVSRSRSARGPVVGAGPGIEFGGVGWRSSRRPGSTRPGTGTWPSRTRRRPR